LISQHTISLFLSQKFAGTLSLRFYININKNIYKKIQFFKKYHDFLLTHTTYNTILRQEFVSMFPVFLLSPHFSHKILDMCASPGSKTLQILEYLNTFPSNSITSPGLLISCEIDSKRAAMLSHKTLFLGYPGYVIFNEDANNLPLLKNQGFDRVLCDVPCSGDGTSRKNGLILKNWSYKFGLNLHKIQRNLLRKGLKLLAKGGILIYSTCSLNPIENEAVVSSILEEFIGKLELIDIKEKFQEFQKDFEAISRPGLKKWKVLTRIKKKDVWFEKFEEIPKEGKGVIEKSMFSQYPGIERTRRIYPHLGNTGGFYLAMIRKIEDFEVLEEEKNLKEGNIKKNEENKDISLEKIIEKSKDLTLEGGDNKKPNEENQEKNEENKDISLEKKEGIIKKPKENQEKTLHLSNFLRIIDKNKKVLDNLDIFYGFAKDFPIDRLFGVFADFDDKAPENSYPKRLVIANKGLLAFFLENPGYFPLKTISFGVNVFKFIREEKLAIKYRVIIESLDKIRPFLLKTRVFSANHEEFCYIETLIKKNTEFNELPKDLSLKIQGFSQGPLIITEENQDFWLILWKGVNHVNLLMKIQDLLMLSFRKSLR